MAYCLLILVFLAVTLPASLILNSTEDMPGPVATATLICFAQIDPKRPAISSRRHAMTRGIVHWQGTRRGWDSRLAGPAEAPASAPKVLSEFELVGQAGELTSLYPLQCGFSNFRCFLPRESETHCWPVFGSGRCWYKRAHKYTPHTHTHTQKSSVLGSPTHLWHLRCCSRGTEEEGHTNHRNPGSGSADV